MISFKLFEMSPNPLLCDLLPYGLSSTIRSQRHPCIRTLQLRRQLTTLLRGISRNKIHQCRTEHIVWLQALLPELVPYGIHLRRLEPLLNDTAHKRRKLRFLPTFLGTQLRVYKV